MGCLSRLWERCCKKNRPPQQPLVGNVQLAVAPPIQPPPAAPPIAPPGELDQKPADDGGGVSGMGGLGVLTSSAATATSPPAIVVQPAGSSSATSSDESKAPSTALALQVTVGIEPATETKEEATVPILVKWRKQFEDWYEHQKQCARIALRTFGTLAFYSAQGLLVWALINLYEKEEEPTSQRFGYYLALICASLAMGAISRFNAVLTASDFRAMNADCLAKIPSGLISTIDYSEQFLLPESLVVMNFFTDLLYKNNLLLFDAQKLLILIGGLVIGWRTSRSLTEETVLKPVSATKTTDYLSIQEPTSPYNCRNFLTDLLVLGVAATLIGLGIKYKSTVEEDLPTTMLTIMATQLGFIMAGMKLLYWLARWVELRNALVVYSERLLFFIYNFAFAFVKPSHDPLGYTCAVLLGFQFTLASVATAGVTRVNTHQVDLDTEVSRDLAMEYPNPFLEMEAILYNLSQSTKKDRCQNFLTDLKKWYAGQLMGSLFSNKTWPGRIAQLALVAFILLAPRYLFGSWDFAAAYLLFLYPVGRWAQLHAVRYAAFAKKAERGDLTKTEMFRWYLHYLICHNSLPLSTIYLYSTSLFRLALSTQKNIPLLPYLVFNFIWMLIRSIKNHLTVLPKEVLKSAKENLQQGKIVKLTPLQMKFMFKASEVNLYKMGKLPMDEIEKGQFQDDFIYICNDTVLKTESKTEKGTESKEGLYRITRKPKAKTEGDTQDKYEYVADPISIPVGCEFNVKFEEEFKRSGGRVKNGYPCVRISTAKIKNFTTTEVRTIPAKSIEVVDALLSYDDTPLMKGMRAAGWAPPLGAALAKGLGIS